MKKKPVMLRIDAELYENVKRQVDEEGMYINRWIERAIKRELERTMKKGAGGK